MKNRTQPASPTIYTFPKKSLTPKPADEKTKEIWEKHRATKGKDTTLPVLKN